MKRWIAMLIAELPSWETFLIYIGGIPTIITTIMTAIMVFITTRNKAFSIKDYKNIHHKNKEINRREDLLRTKVLNAPPGVQKLYRWYIGETNYYDLVNRR